MITQSWWLSLWWLSWLCNKTRHHPFSWHSCQQEQLAPVYNVCGFHVLVFVMSLAVSYPEALFTRYNLLSNRFDNRLYRVYKHSTPVWQPAVSCIQPVVKCLYNPVWQPVERTAVRPTLLSNRVWQPVERTVAVCSTWLSNRLYSCQTGCTTWFDNLVWQPAVSCKQTFNWLSNRLENRFDNWLDVCLHNTASCWQTVVSYERGISKQTVGAWVEVGSCDDCQQTVNAWVGRCSEAGHTLITYRCSHKLQCTLQLHSCVDVCLLLLLLRPFNSLLSRTTWVRWHQKGIHSGFYWHKRWWGGSGISWTICKSFAPRYRQITTRVPHHSILQPGCPSCHPTNSVKALCA